jgi:hypothetical protein
VSTAVSRDHESSRKLRRIVRDFPWVHLGIGLFGNAAFVVGSILFFFKSVQTLAIWIFVVASVGMFIGSLGQLLVRIDRDRSGEPATD